VLRPRDQPVDGYRFTLGDDLDITTRQVANVAPQAEAVRLSLSGPSEADALNDAADNHVDALHGGIVANEAISGNRIC
jgi:hypothetical protein